MQQSCNNHATFGIFGEHGWDMDELCAPSIIQSLVFTIMIYIYIYINKYIVDNKLWFLCEFHEAFRKSVAKPNETYKTNLNPSELLIWSHQGAESPEAQTTAPRPWVVLGVPRRCSSRLGCVISESGLCLDNGWIMFWWCFDQGWTMWDLSIWQRNPEHSEICCVKIHPTLSVIRWTSYESMNGKFWRFLKRKVPTYPVQDTHGHRPSEQYNSSYSNCAVLTDFLRIAKNR